MKTKIILMSLLIAGSVAAQETAVSGPLTLEECRTMALEHNIAVRTSALEQEQAAQQKKEAFTNYFPVISAMGGAFNLNRPVIDMAIYDMSMKLLKNGAFGSVTATQPIFVGGQIVNSNKLAKVGVETSRLQAEMTGDEVSLTTERYYWQVVTLQEKIKTLDAVAEMLAQLNSDVTVAVKAGVKMPNDLLQVQLKQNDVESSRINLENGLTVSKLLLAQYIGLDNVEVVSDITIGALPEFPLGLKQEHESALLGTNEYKLLEKNVEAKKLDRRIEVGKNLPSVAVGASVSSNNLLDEWENRAAIFATVSVPLSSWWGGSHAIKRKKLATEVAQQQLEDNSQLLIIRMQNDWNNVEDAYKQLAIAKKSIEQSEENLRLNNDYYRAGISPMSDLLDAQQQYQQTRDKYVDAFADYNTKILEYKQATNTED